MGFSGWIFSAVALFWYWATEQSRRAYWRRIMDASDERDEARKKLKEALEEIKNHDCMRETLRQISVQPCDPNRHDDGGVCSPCHAKSYFDSEANDPRV